MKTISGSEKREECAEKLKQYNIASGLDEQFADLFARLAVRIAESGLGYIPDENIVMSRTVVSGNDVYAAKADIKVSVNEDAFEWKVEADGE